MDDYPVALFLSLVEKACRAEHEPLICKNAVDMQFEMLKKGLFSSLLTEERFCGYSFPVCGHKFRELTVKDFASRVLNDKPKQI